MKLGTMKIYPSILHIHKPQTSYPLPPTYFRIFGHPGIGEHHPCIGESCQNEGLVVRSRFSGDLVQWKFIQVSFTFTNPSARILFHPLIFAFSHSRTSWHRRTYSRHRRKLSEWGVMGRHAFGSGACSGDLANATCIYYRSHLHFV